MVKPFDLSRLSREHLKKSGIKTGFYDPITWIDTGNYALNKRISGDFNKGIPLGDVAVFAGESGSGKSYIVSGNIIRDAIRQGITVILIDTESALKKKWMQALGVDTDANSDLLMRVPCTTIDEVTALINATMEQYNEDNQKVAREDQQKILFVIDSLGFLSTRTDVEQFENGEIKGDKGIKAKQLKALVSQCLRLFNGNQVGLVATNHTYKSQDMYNPDDVVSGGSGFIFAASIIVTMNKRKLKEDEDGQKVKEVLGIRSVIKCSKTRYAKPFEEVEVNIPYDKGMNPNSGLFTMFEKQGLFKKSGHRWSYVDQNGVEHLHYKKDIPASLYKLIMTEYQDPQGPVGVDCEEDETDV